MFITIKRLLYVLLNKLRRLLASLFARPRQPIERMKEKWIADFSKPEKSCFIIKPEIAYNAYLEKGALYLGLKKQNCMAWVETANRVYVNQIIETRFRFESIEEYCAAGIMFRITEQGTYYLALLSNKGYFRLDAVNNHIPRPLIGWTEISGLNEREVNLGIIAKDDHLMLILNGKWLAEAHDTSIPGGHLGFALVSYDTESESSAEAWLDFLSVDSRANAVETEYKKWNNNTATNAQNRFRLAESFAALDYFDAAYGQILKAWKQREEAARSVMATYTEIRARWELLFAARMAMRIEQYTAAEEYINICLAMDAETADAIEGLDALAEKAKILNALQKYDDLIVFLPEYMKRLETEKKFTDIPSLYALLGHACWNIQDYNAAATAWSKAFNLNKNNGLYAANTANAFAMLGKKSKALQYYIDGGKCFLQQKDYAELEALIPKMFAIGKNNQEALALAEALTVRAEKKPAKKAKTAVSEKPAKAKQPVKKPAANKPEPKKETVKKPAVKKSTVKKPAVAQSKTKAKPKTKT
ncbi:MAG: hypothetical protein FWD36_05610 [Treponema sp.]|nr:hypothetical protein [Treponema sp.]